MKSAWTVLLLAAMPVSGWGQAKPITLDEFMNATEVQDLKLSPDGTAAVITTQSPDWQHHRFRSDLWLWRQGMHEARPLTHSGHARAPQWSPDGKQVAFLSDLALPGDAEGDDSKNANDGTDRVWLIAVDGGESFPAWTEKFEAHAFAWSGDGSHLYLSVTDGLSKGAEDTRKAEWKDVVRWREQEHGDRLVSLPLTETMKPSEGPHPPTPGENAPPVPAGAVTLASVEDQITEIAVDPGSNRIAFLTDSVSHRQEDPKHNEVYLVAASGGEPKRLTNNQGRESGLAWGAGKLYFQVGADSGALEGDYASIQGRLYQMDPANGKVDRIGSDFDGSFESFTVGDNGHVVATGQKGTQAQLYRIDGHRAELLPGRPGTYASVDTGAHAKSLLVKYSTLTEPAQAFFVADLDHPDKAVAITAFNPLFAERAQPEWKTYQWKADDGTTVEGMLIYPPHRMGDKKLRMLTLIHGGPADADGNRFGADWYDWANLAAANGWLVFRPNYRGSSGYGDKFMLQIQPNLVSRPGKDILEGVDALVKEGIADPDRLSIGGYSYGGYMTNWLITQTTEFKAAVTGAGAVEHAANWGNDDTSYDDAWYMGGVTPWQNPAIYQSEAALFQMDKVKTPTHIVGGDADVRVSYLEDVLLERALQKLNVPHSLLVFPGEGHPLGKDPWHGYIKVRDELAWLQTYGGGAQ